MKRIAAFLTFFLIYASAIAEVQLNIPEDLTISEGHPRLFINNKEFAQMKKQISWGYNTALVKMHESYLELAAQSVEDNDPFEMNWVRVLMLTGTQIIRSIWQGHLRFLMTYVVLRHGIPAIILMSPRWRSAFQSLMTGFTTNFLLR